MGRLGVELDIEAEFARELLEVRPLRTIAPDLDVGLSDALANVRNRSEQDVDLVTRRERAGVDDQARFATHRRGFIFQRRPQHQRRHHPRSRRVQAISPRKVADHRVIAANHQVRGPAQGAFFASGFLGLGRFATGFAGQSAGPEILASSQERDLHAPLHQAMAEFDRELSALELVCADEHSSGRREGQQHPRGQSREVRVVVEAFVVGDDLHSPALCVWERAVERRLLAPVAKGHQRDPRIVPQHGARERSLSRQRPARRPSAQRRAGRHQKDQGVGTCWCHSWRTQGYKPQRPACAVRGYRRPRVPRSGVLAK